MMKLPPRKYELPRSFYDRDTVQVARELIGKVLLRKTGNTWAGGMIVETEAYLQSGDLASHSARGPTPGNSAMFCRPGTLYVYPIHAKHCLNAVTESEGLGCAVLIRAIEPMWGLDLMRRRRGYDDSRRLTRGPAMLCQALAVDRRDDRVDLVEHPRFRISELPTTIDNRQESQHQVQCSARIGIRKSADLPYRFLLGGNRYVSR